MGRTCVKIEAKMTPNCLLEASLGLRGNLWEPCGSPGVPRGSKLASRVALLDTILELIFGSFLQFEGLWGLLFWGRGFGLFLKPNLHAFKVNFE